MLQKIWKSFLAFLGIIMPFINEWIVPAINLVDVIKKFIKDYNPSHATPFDELVGKFKEDVLKFFENDVEKAEDFINKLIVAASSLNLGVQCFSLPTQTLQLSCFLKWLNSQPLTIKDAMYHKLAGALAKAEGAPGDQHHIDAMVQVAYTKIKDRELPEVSQQTVASIAEPVKEEKQPEESQETIQEDIIKREGREV